MLIMSTNIVMPLTPDQFFREERVALMPEAVFASVKLCAEVSAESLQDDASNEAYLQRRWCHFAQNDQLRYI